MKFIFHINKILVQSWEEMMKESDYHNFIQVPNTNTHIIQRDRQGRLVCGRVVLTREIHMSDLVDVMY